VPVTHPCTTADNGTDSEGHPSMSTSTTAPTAFARAEGLTIKRVYTTLGTDPYDTVAWENRDVVQTDWRTGATVFEQLGVEFPTTWSVNASTIVTSKYFRGALGTPARESSLKQLIDRVVTTYRVSGEANGYFATAEDAEIFDHELRYMLVHQVFSFNSPVWFNVGTPSPQQVSACFILSVDDTMDSILNWYREEGMIFKGGSGAGLNLSRLRGSTELLSSGGTASGPVSFMRGADASAGTIKSGGSTRRAAKMVVLDINHPDIRQFIQTKAREEDKIRALKAAGFDMDLGGADISSVQYQNANNSVRVDDAFMKAYETGGSYDLLARADGHVTETVDARALMREVATAAWECADPGIQYDGTINAWHTTPESGRINASNPCSEYMSLDNTSCNLASLNLMKFLTPSSDGVDTFDTARFVAAVEIIITAMDISICFADFPTEAIGRNTRDFRQLGIGFANLGALLMATGRAYDSAEGRSVAAAITAVMTGVSYRRSAELAGVVGPYAGYAKNASPHTAVMAQHAIALDFVPRFGGDEEQILDTATEEWARCLRIGSDNGWRNAQASVLAPTGTIGFMMDCDTTGVEPDFSLVKFKKLVGGGSMQIVNGTVTRALTGLGYTDDQISAINAHILATGEVTGAPGLAERHYPVFDCAVGASRYIAPMGHVSMMAAVQPFLSGAISKTVNLPDSATVEDIEKVYYDGWKTGLKALAVYRDNCKVGQPLSNSKTEQADKFVEATAAAPAAETPVTVEPTVVYRPTRRRLPRDRAARTVSFTVGGQEGYVTFGEYDDGSLGEMFLKVSQQGSTMAGICDAFATAVSVALQYGVPLETLVAKFANTNFVPQGMTNDPEVRMASSLLDYLFRKAAVKYLPKDSREFMGILTPAEKASAIGDEPVATASTAAGAPTLPTRVLPVVIDPQVQDAAAHKAKSLHMEAPMCAGSCGTNLYMAKTGGCWCCSACGTSLGCS
jgi:ribonucleoside-diphosphate reductase alpha chain